LRNTKEKVLVRTRKFHAKAVNSIFSSWAMLSSIFEGAVIKVLKEQGRFGEKNGQPD
jgi:hypothetical protein